MSTANYFGSLPPRLAPDTFDPALLISANREARGIDNPAVLDGHRDLSGAAGQAITQAVVMAPPSAASTRAASPR